MGILMKLNWILSAYNFHNNHNEMVVTVAEPVLVRTGHRLFSSNFSLDERTLVEASLWFWFGSNQIKDAHTWCVYAFGGYGKCIFALCVPLLKWKFLVMVLWLSVGVCVFVREYRVALSALDHVKIRGGQCRPPIPTKAFHIAHGRIVLTASHLLAIFLENLFK